LDWIARWLTGREIGIALGAGAACGFAHLGVLQVLEEAGIHVDYFCGSSMGGALALLGAMTGSADRTIEIVRDVAGSSDKVVDVTWFPRPALLYGRKSKEIALKTWGNTTLAEFEKPSAAVAADLVRGGRFVFDRGPGSIAARATTAIPGIFPPIPHEGRLLVDGALVSRIPLDLLDGRGCGLKMAINVIPSPEQKSSNVHSDWQQMNQRFNAFLGLRHVIASSWALLAWWQGTSEAQSADIIFEPRTEKQAGYDFSSLDEMITAGRIAAQEKLAVVEKSVATLLKPGAP
jgi:NTE family protein